MFKWCGLFKMTVENEKENNQRRSVNEFSFFKGEQRGGFCLTELCLTWAIFQNKEFLNSWFIYLAYRFLFFLYLSYYTSNWCLVCKHFFIFFYFLLLFVYLLLYSFSTVWVSLSNKWSTFNDKLFIPLHYKNIFLHFWSHIFKYFSNIKINCSNFLYRVIFNDSLGLLFTILHDKSKEMNNIWYLVKTCKTMSRLFSQTRSIFHFFLHRHICLE